MIITTFEEALEHSSYSYDKHVGAWMKEEENGTLHTYMHIEDNDWIYEEYDKDDNEIKSIAFTL